MATKTREATDEPGDVPGAEADRPAEVPARGWGLILRRAWKESKADQVPLLGAGVAFYAFMSLFPAMIALILRVRIGGRPGPDRRPGQVSPPARCPLMPSS